MGNEESIFARLTDDMKRAMKEGDKERLSVIRMLRSELKNAQIAAGGDLDIDQERKTILSYAKKRKEAIAKYKEAGRADLVERESKEYEITMSYLPPMLTEEELSTIIERHIGECGAGSVKDFGKVMKAVMAEVGSRADGSEVSRLLKMKLGGA